MINSLNILTIINSICIILILIKLYSHNTEDLTDVPNNFTNIMMTDTDGNIHQMSTATLQKNINESAQNIFNNSIKPVNKQLDSHARNLSTSTANLSNKINTVNSSLQAQINTKQAAGNYVVVDEIYSAYLPVSYGADNSHDNYKNTKIRT